MEDVLSNLLERQKPSHSAPGDDFTTQPAVEKDRESRILDGSSPLAVIPVKRKLVFVKLVLE